MDVHETVAPLPSDVPVTIGRRVRRRKDRDSDWQLLRCMMCQGAEAFQASNGHGLMIHLVAKHRGQALPEDTIVQLRALGREACGVCGTIRALWLPICVSCGCITATRILQSGDAVVPPTRRTVRKHVCKKRDEMHECKKCGRVFSCKLHLNRHLFKEHMVVIDSEKIAIISAKQETE